MFSFVTFVFVCLCVLLLFLSERGDFNLPSMDGRLKSLTDGGGHRLVRVGSVIIA